MLTNLGTLRSLRALGFCAARAIHPYRAHGTVTVRRRSPVFGLPGLFFRLGFPNSREFGSWELAGKTQAELHGAARAEPR